MSRLLLACLLCLPAITGAEIPPGSHVLLRMVNSLNTRTAQEGDFVYLQTASPLSVNDHIALPIGSYVQGVVSHSKRSGRVVGRAELGIRLETLTLADGRNLKISPRLASVDSGEAEQTVDRRESMIRENPERLKDFGRIAIFAGGGATIGGLGDRSWKGAGIGGAAGTAVGIATVLLTRGREVELRQGMTLDVTFDRPLTVE